MSTPTLLLASDVISHAENFASARASVDLYAIRSALEQAYQDVGSAFSWTFLQRSGRVHLKAPYTTGTVAYDHCVTPDHEALTRTGWKRYTELQIGEEILAYDHDLERCSWQKIKALHVFQYDGDILEVMRKGRTILRCTPNHQIPVYKRCGHKYLKWRKEFVSAQNLTEEDYVPLAAPLFRMTAGPLDDRLVAILAWSVTDGSGLFRRWATPRIHQSPSANPEKLFPEILIYFRYFHPPSLYQDRLFLSRPFH